PPGGGHRARWARVHARPPAGGDRRAAVHDRAHNLPARRGLGECARRRRDRHARGGPADHRHHDLAPRALRALPALRRALSARHDRAPSTPEDPMPGAARHRYHDTFAHPSGARPPQLPAPTIPGHVAVVMDGNGRWANRRGLPRTAGHEAGEAALLDVVAGALQIGVTHLSAYAFSTENWKRSLEEV